jgi:hypothetical protein
MSRPEFSSGFVYLDGNGVERKVACIICSRNAVVRALVDGSMEYYCNRCWEGGSV